MIWDIQRITKISKKEILETVYPDELDYIYANDTTDRINHVVEVMAALQSKKDNQKTIIEVLYDDLNKLRSKDNETKSTKPKTKEDIARELDKLRGLQRKTRRIK